MKHFIRKHLSFSLILLILLMPFSAIAQTQPPMTVSVPANIQVEVDEDFSIPLTIASGANALRVGWVIPTLETPGVNIPSRHINQDMSANSTMNVPLTGRAFSEEGFFRVIIDVYGDATLDGSVSVRNEVLIEVVDPDAQEDRPNFNVSDVHFDPASPDPANPFTVIMEIRNFGDEPSGTLTATLDAKDNFYIESLTNRADVASVEPNQNAKLSFKLRAKDNRTSNEVALTLSYDTYTQTQTIFLPLPDVPDPLGPPVLKVDSFTLTPAQQGQFLLRLAIVNEGESEAENISLSLDAGGKAFPLSGGNVRTIRELAPDAKANVEYLLSSQGELTAHPVNIAFDFFDENDTARKGSDRIFITSDLEPSIRLTGFNVRPAGEEGEFTLALNFKNDGLSKAHEITVRFTGNQASPLNRGAVLNMADIPAGGSANLSLLMQTKLEGETYTIPFEVTYRSQAGAEHQTTDTVVVTADSIGIELEGILPVLLDRHTLSKNNVSPGSEFTLNLHIRNISNEPTGIAKITLGEARVGNTGGSIFSTADGRTAFVAESIPANGEIIKQISLIADSEAQAMIYSLPVTIEYEDIDGKVSVLNTTVAIPVRHEGRLRVLTMDILPSAAVGEAVPVSIEFANTGRVNLDNMFISLEGDFEKENATFFIPSFEHGTSDFFHATLFPDTEGTLTGKIVITYDDADANEVRLEHPFTIEVTPSIPAVAGMPGRPGQGLPGNPEQASFPWLYAGIAGIIVAAGVFFAVKRIKANKRAMSVK